MKKLMLLAAMMISGAGFTGAYAQNETAQLSEEEMRVRAMVENHIEAPAFTLKNLEGKDVSLSDFRGKWVILDFWGSWCGWCIKGIPSMKEAYETYHPKGLEIIGIDCGDSDQQWREAVERYQLPWVNVYNPGKRSDVTREYNILGFPTKVIVNPEGRIHDIVIGEDPAFYDLLRSLF